MFEFFIALFGGIWSSGTILAEASEQSHSKQKSDRQTARRDAWKAQVVDRALEEDLRDYVSKHENRELVWAEIQEVYRTMNFQKVYASANEWALDGATNKTKAGKMWYRHHRFDEPLDILLAKHGKLRYEKSWMSVAHLYPGEGQRTRAEWDRTVEFWTYIRDELRKHGIDAKLLLKSGFKPNSMEYKYYDIEDVDTFRYQPGDLVWLHDTSVGL